MKRNVNFEDISDGKRYKAEDMVRADCGGCVGCHACCQGMGDSIVLDPLDVKHLKDYLSCSFEQLLAKAVSIHVIDGLILPSLSMNGEDHSCVFLNQEGRCSIHEARPGICRLFPLGRIYEDGSMSYFLQIYECAKQNRSKIKVKKWLDMPEFKQYEAFVLSWHNFLEELEPLCLKSDGKNQKMISMYVLKQFYQTPFDDDFYQAYQQRLERARQVLGLNR